MKYLMIILILCCIFVQILINSRYITFMEAQHKFNETVVECFKLIK